MPTAYDGPPTLAEFHDYLERTGSQPYRLDPLAVIEATKPSIPESQTPETVLDRLAAIEAEIAALPTPQALLDRMAQIDREIAAIQGKNGSRRAELETMKRKDLMAQTLRERQSQSNLVDNIFGAQADIKALEGEKARIREETGPFKRKRQSLNDRRNSTRETIGMGLVSIFQMLNFLLGLYLEGEREKAAAEEAARQAEREARRDERKKRGLEAERATRDQRHADHKARQRAAQEAKQARLAAQHQKKPVAPPPTASGKKKPDKDNGGKPRKK